MVRPDRRGQLILIGALLLATVIFGVSVLLNSTLYSGMAGAGDVDGAIDRTDRLTFEAKRGVRSLLVRVNHRGRSVTGNQAVTAAAGNVSRYGQLLAESAATGGPMALNLTLNESSSSVGYRVVQVADGEFTDEPGNGAFDVVPHSLGARIGWATMNVEVANVTGPFTVTAGNATEVIEYEFDQTPAGNLSVAVSLPSGSTTATCVETNGRVLLDLYDGVGYRSNCTFDGFGRFDDPMNLSFEDGDRAVGRYSVVASDVSFAQVPPAYRECTDTPTPAESDPCAHPVVWTANFTMGIQTDSLDYRNRFNLSVYPGAP
jgi:hypothetical protein